MPNDPIRPLLASGAALVLFFVGGTVAAAQHEHPAPAGSKRTSPKAAQGEQELKVGKKDDVTFTREVRLGEITLQPGKYRIQHRVEGADHFVHFTSLLTTTPSAHKTASGVGIPAGEAGEVKCRLEPLEKKARETTLQLQNEGDSQRVIKILIRGENVAHAF